MRALWRKMIETWDKIKPFHGVVIFFVVMMIANWTWKIFIHDGNDDPLVTLFGWNISWPFMKLRHEVIRVAGLVFNLFNIPFGLIHRTTFVFANGTQSEIAWGCTGIKQAFIYTCIIAFSGGPWRNKWWYILAAYPLLHFFNIARVSIVGAVLASNPHYFEIVHTWIFKYAFYFLIFLLWVVWEEHFHQHRLKKQNPKQTNSLDFRHS
jgi:exosortase/archaeosortase family protein